LPKIRRNPFIEIVPINVGCLNQCTYCKTKHARGQLSSWSTEEIVSRINTVISEGVKEIRMTSEDTGAYGRDIGTNIGNTYRYLQLTTALAELLNQIVPILPDGVMLRVGMTNPPYILGNIGCYL
jgi:threonylcarbamoyladenosine tRNA methylthiotransferase CDKAL1